MGVDVYRIRPLEQDEKDFLFQARQYLPESMYEMIEANMGHREWVMQFGTSYLTWLHWIVTASGEDPSRVGMMSPETNTRFIPLLPDGHPWGSGGIYLRDEECSVLERDLGWFIEEIMPNINGCDYLKSKTELLFRAVQRVAEAGVALYIG